MKHKRVIFTIAVLAFAGIFLGVGCSGDTSAKKKTSIVDELADSLASAISQNIPEVTLASATAVVPPDETSPAETNGSAISDFVVVDSNVYVVYGGNLLVYNLTTDEQFTITANEKLKAVVYHDGTIYTGGDGLYKVVDSALEPVDIELTGVVNALYSYDYRLMIGTSCGLQSKSIFGNELLFDDIDVTAMTVDNNGFWVATAGQGLYRWDGNEFHQRYLRRDTSIFDFVNTLDFNHNHLYVGTDDALYIYDGGRWKTVDTEDGLPSSEIRDIDASNWVVYVTTNAGLVSFFNDEIAPVKKLDDINPSMVQVVGKTILVATEDGRLVKKTGPVVQTLLEPDDDVTTTNEPVAMTVQ